MATQYVCGSPGRRRAVLETQNADGLPLLNGIDYLEVSDDQLTLSVFFLHPLPGQPEGVPGEPVLTAANLRIEGGVRVTGIRALEPLQSQAKVLTVPVSARGDFSTYRLRLVKSPDSPEVPEHFDPQLAAVEFSFKVGWASEFDCKTEQICPAEQLPAPAIDYLARDYASFRRLMLDRMAVTLPGWTERNPADQTIAVVEALAYAADRLSYYQDAAATEAYLGTARRRVSLRRHARLLDYPMHEGCNARAWVALEVSADGDGTLLPGPDPAADRAETDRPGALLATQTSLARGSISAADLARVGEERPLYFETMHAITLYAAHNEIHFYTWGDDDCCLPKGATRATLRDTGGVLTELKAGDVLLFEEARSPTTGLEADADPTHRHVVRLTRVEHGTDDLFPENAANPLDPQRLRVVDIEWDAADALPFPLCLRQVADPAAPDKKVPVGVARGNIVLADHGRTRTNALDPIAGASRYRPRLPEWPLAWQGYVRDRAGRLVVLDQTTPAATALSWEPRDTIPAIRLRQGSPVGPAWLPQRDLLAGGRFAREFVVEVEEDGRASLRFGDGKQGRLPPEELWAVYRVGNGAAGNVGAEAIAHVVDVPGVLRVRNPLPARGGQDPEPLEQVRLYAPQAFRHQERAVTEADYAEVAQRHPGVARAVATRRWTGGWYTMYLTIDRTGGRPVDADFEADLRAFLELFRLMGHDLEIDGPRFVPLQIVLSIEVKPGYFRSSVKRALLDIFSSRDLPDGRRGFFHPDNFTFGQPVYLSQIVAIAMQVPGVQWVDTVDFQRWGQPPCGELAAGAIKMNRLEIVRLDNDPNAPENGHMDFLMQGGM